MANQPILSYVKKKFLPAWGSQIMNEHWDVGSYQSDSPPDFVNCCPIKTPVAGGEAIWTVEPRAAAVDTDNMTDRQIATTTNTYDFRGDVQTDDGFYYVVIEDDLYRGLPGTGTYTKISTGGFNYSTGNVSCTYTPDHVVFLENHATASYIHAVHRTTNVFTTTALGIGTYCTPCFLDGYIFICSRNQDSTPAAGPSTQRIYNSDLGAPATFTLGTNYLDAEQFPDGIVDLAVHKNHIVAFGSRSIEFFYNAGRELGSPLLRNASYATNYGLIPRVSGATYGWLNSAYTKVDDTIYFIGAQAQGAVSVFELDNFRVKDVASKYVRGLLADYSADSRPGAPLAQIGTFNTYGDTCVIIGGAITPNFITQIDPVCYSPKSKIWTTISWNTIVDDGANVWAINEYKYNSQVIMNDASFPTAGVSGMIYTRSSGGTVYFTTVAFHPNMVSGSYEAASTGGNEGAETVTCAIHKDFHDFSENYNWKTISELEVVGYFDSTNHTLTLSYGTEPGTNTTTSAGALTGAVLQEGSPRWYNLGRHRKFSIKLSIDADQRFVLRGFNLTYNEGTS